MEKYLLPVYADLLFRLQPNALFLGYRLQHLPGAITVCHHGCEVSETAPHLFWYCDFAVHVWTVWTLMKMIIPYFGFKFGSSLFLAEIWQNILAYCSCPLPLRVWPLILGFLLSAYTFLGFTLLVIGFLLFLPLIYWPANAPV